jgi:hypothetical protein
MPWGLYYFVLWVVPIFTTFSFFMILRQTVQHGNASRHPFTDQKTTQTPTGEKSIVSPRHRRPARLRQ